MKSMMRRTTFREIRQSFGRYAAIMSIIALGVGFFSGLKVTKQAMWETTNEYLKELNLFDYHLVSTLGLTDEDVEDVRGVQGVEYAEGAYYADALVMETEGEKVVRFLSWPENLNGVKIRSGRAPEHSGEVVLDARYYPDDVIGEKIVIADTNTEENLDRFHCLEYEVVGLGYSSLYLNYERGSTTVGNGSINYIYYILPEDYNMDYYTDIYVTMQDKFYLFSDGYDDMIDANQESLEQVLTACGERRYRDIYDEADHKLADAEAELADHKAEVADAEQKLEDGRSELKAAQDELADAESELARGREELENNRSLYEDGKTELTAQKKQFDAAYLAAKEQVAAYLAAGGIPYTEEMIVAQVDAMPQIAAAKSAIAVAERKLKVAEDALAEGEKQLADAEAELADGRAKIEENRQKLADAEAELAEGQEKLADAEAELLDHRQELADLERPTTYVLTRETNVGYVSFHSDSEIVEGIAVVFPVFFFLVAALVCITTMNRMVEEQRTQIGVLKALGYSKMTIMGKYMIYSGSAALIGCIGGFFLGSYIFPKTIWTVYGLMYGFTDIHFVFNGGLFAISMAVALLCSIGTTWASCRYELAGMAAELIRPKSPKAGKRIFLEHVPFIWKRLKFLYKVSIRNVVRYKKRFFMMVLGISGCTGLIVTGYGIQDSIVGISDAQYGTIMVYDESVSFTDPLTEEEMDALSVDWADKVELIMPIYQNSVDIVGENMVKSTTIIVPRDSEKFGELVDLHTVSGEPIPFPEYGEVVLAVNTAKQFGIHVGDMVTLRNSDMKEMTLKVAAISQNFFMTNAFLSAETYEGYLGKAPEYRTAFVNVAAGQNLYDLSADFLERDNISAVTVNEETRAKFNKMMKTMNYIVILVIACAAALAFIVLYNLTNINITERIREIATIKVLGFYPGETASYVFRENMVLTAIGALVGLPLGIALHRFVMSQIKIDMVRFDVHINGITYLYAILFTFGFAVIVDIAMYFKLKKINMAESLKSIE